MLSFIDTKPFGAACTGLGTLGTGYMAGASGWSMIALALLTAIAYHFVFADGPKWRPTDPSYLDASRPGEGSGPKSFSSEVQ
jgi:hypothetical protein